MKPAKMAHCIEKEDLISLYQSKAHLQRMSLTAADATDVVASLLHGLIVLVSGRGSKSERVREPTDQPQRPPSSTVCPGLSLHVRTRCE